MGNRRFRGINSGVVLATMWALASVSPLQGATPEQVAAEMSGLEAVGPVDPPERDPAAHQQALGMLPDTGLLLIPESTNDRVMAFDPMTGDLVDADFVPADPANLTTPIHAILSADGASILVSDQTGDVVQQYDLAGNHLGIFAPAGGADPTILDNIRGIALRPNGNLLVTVGSGANDDAVAEFDTAGAFLGNFVANGAGGLDSPFDVFERASGTFLVGGITSDTVHEFDAAGAPLPDFAPLDTFPEQIYETPSGNILIGNFSGTQEGVVELDSGGGLVGVYDPPSLGGYRGAYELPNGNILTTNGGGVHEIDRGGNLVETKIAGVSARFIEFVGGSDPGVPVVEIPTLSTWGLVAMLLALASLGFVAVRRLTLPEEHR